MRVIRYIIPRRNALIDLITMSAFVDKVNYGMDIRVLVREGTLNIGSLKQMFFSGFGGFKTGFQW